MEIKNAFQPNQSASNEFANTNYKLSSKQINFSSKWHTYNSIINQKPYLTYFGFVFCFTLQIFLELLLTA